MAVRKGKIGVFDSGFGGINILRGIVKEIPEYDYLYLGDTARTPYGTRSADIVYGFSKQAVDFFFKHDCDVVIFACNTASSDALHRIQHDYLPAHYPNKKVLGVLIPAAEEAMLKTKNKKIGVIATEGTVHSGAFIRELSRLDENVRVFQRACPLLVPLVEEGEHASEVGRIILEKYLAPLRKKGIDTLILGCTHYGILESRIKKIIGPNVTVISEARAVPKRLKQYLLRHPEIERTLTRKGTVTFCTTDMTERFERLGSEFFGKKIKARGVSLL